MLSDVVDALEEQVSCYRRLARLAELQHLHVQQDQNEALLDVLRSRETVLTEITRLETTIGPAKREWQKYAGAEPSLRAKAEQLFGEARSLLAEITAADEQDALVLRQRKFNLGRQLNQTTSARQINRSYGVAAYGNVPGGWTCSDDGIESMTVATENPPPVSPQRIEELGRIIMAYSEVTERLQQSHDQLKDQVESLREELGEKNRLLERKNRLAALGEMAAGMAHEIRNPLGGIQLYASLLAKDVADRPKMVQVCDKISSGVKRLESLVSQILHFTREINVNLTEMDLAEVVQQAVELCQQQAAIRRVEVRVTGPSSMRVLGDPIFIGQALMNLLLNAIDAMQTPGEISISYWFPDIACEARQFCLRVRDHGPGIPAHVLDRIFNPFFTTKDSGTGLGLAIVHRVVEAHDGTIIAANAEDGGAMFEIRI